MSRDWSEHTHTFSPFKYLLAVDLKILIIIKSLSKIFRICAHALPFRILEKRRSGKTYTRKLMLNKGNFLFGKRKENCSEKPMC